MAKSNKSIDGFTLQRRDTPDSSRAAVYANLNHKAKMTPAIPRTNRTDRMVAAQNVESVEESVGNDLTAELNESLAEIEKDAPTPTKKEGKRAKRQAKKQKNTRYRKNGKKKWSKKRKIITALVLLLLLLASFFVWKVLENMGKVFEGNPLALITSTQRLKTDAYGRTNILVFGDESDSAAHIANDAGANLTDSIMVVSVNQDKKDAFLYSIPRDLWVKYPTACTSGYEGKINAVYMCARDVAVADGASKTMAEKAGADQLRKTVSEYMGQDVQYYAKADFKAVQESVDAVGGITVTIDSDDPRGILDRNFDWECNYKCYYVKYANGPVNLDGKHALALARARNASGGYGLSGGNFDREQYQQKIIIAVKDKAVSAGTISNPVKVTKLLDAFGNNIVTNFQAGEVQSLAKLATNIDSKDIKQISFVKPTDGSEAVMTTDTLDGQSIVRPTAGIYDFSQVQAFLKRQLNAEPAASEKATIGVYNGSGVEGEAATLADRLYEKGFDATAVGNVATTKAKYTIYDLTTKTVDGKTTSGKPKTSEYLAKKYGVTIKSATASDLPNGVTADKNFVIIIGSDGSN